MGRRKQANPTRLADSSEASTSGADLVESSANGDTTVDGLKHSNGTDKKLNFSISAHLQQADKQNSTKARKAGGTQNGCATDSAVNVSYLAAQKAYQTLMSNLNRQEALMKSMGFANNSAAAFFMNPFLGAGMSPFDVFSNGVSSSTPKKRQKIEDDSAVDLSTKKKRANDTKTLIKSSNEPASNSALEKLSSLVTKVGSPSHISSIVRGQTTTFGQDISTDPTRVFTCLQCFERFKSIQELADHMQKTLHFNQLKSFANSSTTFIKHKSNTNSPVNSPSPNDKTRANSRGGTFSFECLLCGHSSSGSIDEHMKTQHSFSSPNDWISAVKLIPL